MPDIRLLNHQPDRISEPLTSNSSLEYIYDSHYHDAAEDTKLPRRKSVKDESGDKQFYYSHNPVWPQLALSLRPQRLIHQCVLFDRQEIRRAKVVEQGNSWGASENEVQAALKLESYLEAKATIEEMRPKYVIRLATESENAEIIAAKTTGIVRPWYIPEYVPMDERSESPTVPESQSEPRSTSTVTKDEEQAYLIRHTRGKKQSNERMREICGRLALAKQTDCELQDLYLHVRFCVWCSTVKVNADVVEDIVRRAFENIIKKVHECNGQFDSFVAYVYKTALNEAKSMGRKTRKEDKYLKPFVREEEAPQDGAFESPTMWEIEERQQAFDRSTGPRMSLEKLKPSLYPFVKDFAEGYSDSEIAKRQGVSERTVDRKRNSIKERTLNGDFGDLMKQKGRLKAEKKERRLVDDRIKRAASKAKKEAAHA